MIAWFYLYAQPTIKMVEWHSGIFMVCIPQKYKIKSIKRLRTDTSLTLTDINTNYKF